ncbi:phenolphthiocerol/phthiocerol polyketide synthase subunit B-like [Amphiura filiformis]|uniref:phenolphthiocerol/phthiocerol polyketide synthase subunit B-like n=1 Tax=Amphiura filiformis TaxID=82378 RepID=UPI003B21024A
MNMEEQISHQTSDSRGKFPIAIVGIGCRMPGGVTSPEEFWDVLVKGRDMVSEIPPNRWSIESFYHKNQSVHSKMVTKRCGFIHDIDKFDNSFFQISPREAASMDPQQRHMLEVAYEAFQDAGIIPSTCGDCGVYIAVGRMDYPIMIMDTSITNPYTLTGIAHSVVANRISYVFNFKGPSLVVDTACASSFTAMHLACSSLWNGECSVVLAGGANPVIIPEVTVGYSALGVLSPEGMSCPFSDTAKGYVRSEGWGAFILKPLDAALQNNDHIYAVIRGSAIACNGSSKSLTMPCSETQKMVMRMAYEKFNIPMSSVQFVEAHGTGTPVGDPIEAQAIGETFGSINKEPIKIGSVKSNFGHTECASGVTSAIKVALMLNKRQLVPSINFRNINPSINLKRLNIRVQTCNEPIEDAEQPYRVGLNSFGFAGAVAHMIFEGAPKQETDREIPMAGWKFGETQSKKGKYVILPLSAKCPEALTDLAKKWVHFSSDVDALQVASWQATKREHHTYKLAVVAESSDTFRSTLTSFLQDEIKDTLVKGDDIAHSKPKICFVFPGQGQQWYNMGRQLYQDEIVFRDTINECDSIFKRLSGWSLIERTGVFNGISPNEAKSPDIIEQVEILQPTIHFFQIALFHMWKHWGIRPDFVVGHSLGEIAAAYAAGALTLKEAISVVYYRAAQQATLSGTGSMAAVRSDRETAEALCKSYPDVHIAAINGPGSVTISGNCDHIGAIVKSNAEKAKQLRVTAAYHTQFMSPIEAKFRKSMDNVISSDSSNRTASFYSTVSGECYKDPLNVDYWWENIRRPVLFQPAIESILHDTDVSIFLEVSATATLRSDVQKILHFNDPMRQMSVVVSGRRNANDQMYALLALGNLYNLGVNINWNKVTHNAAQWAPIPTYPWQHHQSLWIEAEDHQNVRLGMDDRSFKGKNGYITTDTFAFLSEYFEDDVLVFPCSGFLKYASEIVFGDRNAAFKNVHFLKPLSWSTDDSHREIALKLDMKRVGYHIEITEKDTTYFKATITDTDDNAIAKEEADFDADDVLDRCSTYLSKEDFYHQLQVTGITNETALQVVDEVYLGDSESVTYVNVESLTNKQHAFLAALNAAFQAASVTVQQPTIKYRPIGLESIILQPSFFTAEESRMIIYTDVVDCDGHFLVSNLLILSDSGSVLGIIKNLECHNVDKRTSTFDIQTCFFTMHLQPLEACNLSTSIVSKNFEEPNITAICGKDASAIKRAEEMADDIENICVSYIKHALDTVPDVEQAKGKRYHKYMAIYDAVQTRYTQDITPYDGIPEVMDKVLAHCPELEVEMHLAKRLGEALPDTLRNPHTCVPIMFSADCLDRYFWDGLSMKIYYEAAANAVIRSVKQSLKTKQVVRVLELGGRVGGFTRFVVEPLKQFGMSNRLEYVFTDVSATFFTQARTKLPGCPFIQYQVLSVDRDVAEQGFVPGSFDIVVCVDTLHVAVDARRSTGFMNDLLLPNGHLYIIEGTNTHFLTELWFGTMDVCLVFEDERTQILNKSCWFHREGWVQVMKDVGLQDVVSASTEKEFYHSVMVGRKPSSTPVKHTNNIGINEQTLVFEDDTKVTPPIQHRGNKRNVPTKTKTLGEEMALALKGTVKIKPFSQIQQLANTLKRIQQPSEVIYLHSGEDEGLITLLDLLQIAGTIHRKISRLWVVVRTKENHLTSNSGLVLGLVQSLCNRVRSVPLYSLHVASTSGFNRVAQQFAVLRSQSLLAEHHFVISKSGSLKFLE